MDDSYDERAWWDARYARGGTSGAGSAGAEADWKVEQILRACEGHCIATVLDLGCGDGAVGRAVLAGLPGASYLGIDQAPSAIRLCQALAPAGAEYREADICSSGLPQADLVLCLDVLFHLQGQARHHAAVAAICGAFRSLAAIAAWNERIVERYRGRFAAHTAYRPLVLPPGVRCVSTDLPMVREKTLHVVTRVRSEDERD